MPSKLKKLVRERMAKTGERYTTALARLRAQRARINTSASAAPRASRSPCIEPDLIVARYFGQPVTFAIVSVRGRCLMMLAPPAAQTVAQVRRPAWQLLSEHGVQ